MTNSSGAEHPVRDVSVAAGLSQTVGVRRLLGEGPLGKRSQHGSCPPEAVTLTPAHVPGELAQRLHHYFTEAELAERRPPALGIYGN